MQRTNFFYFLLGGLFLLASCNTPSNNNGTGEQVEDQVEAAQQNLTATVSEMGDENLPYEVKVVDATVKSPRKELTGKLDDITITINYGSPAVNGRTIYGELVPYGKVWRTGANEATRITFDQAVEVGEEDVVLEAGTYSLFTLPTDKDTWTIIFNKTAEQWGAYDYAEDQDAARVSGEAEIIASPAERMDFALGDEEVELMWADMKISFEVEAAESR